VYRCMVNKGLHLYNLFITRMSFIIYFACAYPPPLLEFKDYIDNPKLLGYCSDSMICVPFTPFSLFLNFNFKYTHGQILP
jgi:hypothetical protein